MVWIEALRIEGGVLDGFNQRFAPKLNVLIGGRGTGKSSVIELIRFGLGASAYTDAAQQESMEHALGVLGDGQITITLTNGQERIEVVRTAQGSEVELPDAFVAPFVFSQAEIETIGLQAQSRLRLIDGFLSSAQRPAVGESSNAAKIRSATAEIRTLLTEIDDIDEKTAELSKLQTQLGALKAQSGAKTTVHKEIEGHRTTLAAVTPQVAAARVRAEVIARSADRLNDWTDHLEEVLDRRPTIERWPAQAATTDELADLRKKETQAGVRLRGALEDLNAIAAELGRKKAAASSQHTGLENRARDIRQKIEEKQKGASAIDKRISDLTQQISVLKSLVDLRKERDARVKHLIELRSKMLEQQDASRQTRTKAREKIAAVLSKDLAPSVRIKIIPSAQHREYVAALVAALRGSGLRYAELSERIAETYSPQEIASLAEARDVSEIASALEISDDRALRLCDALRGPHGSALFTASAEDDVNIELMDGADYKGIDFLSMGQRCTTILPIILRHTERMIILDQPEDHLDNAFVVGTLIKAVAVRSRTAQSIVATHNPNIPVLGEATRVLHLDSDGNRCFVRSAGALDKQSIVEAITSIMEGGREAFARRAEFYAKHRANDSKS